ncbi:MAG: hypothetical protein GY799_21125 [Desulfobulbaceae bacterium]|nr:hypothetical protein [Desulfobulbaceae bacterium]
MSYKEKCLKMWNWLRESEDGTTKTDYFNEFPVAKEPWGSCYACQYTVDRDGGANSEACNCPVVWTEEGKQECLDYGSPYRDWREDRTADNADAVYQVIKETWRDDV